MHLKALVLLIAVLLAVDAGASGKCPAPPAQSPADGQLVAVDPVSRSVVELAENKQNSHRFGRELCLYYGIKRPGSGPGVVAARVARIYNDRSMATTGDRGQTLIYRSAVPGKEALIAQRSRNRYHGYHSGKLEDTWFTHQFHVSYGKERSNGSDQRKAGFLFNHAEKLKPESHLQRAYLLYYDGVRPEGTWVPFEVGTNADIARIAIALTDLGAEGMGDLVDRVWTVARE